MFICRIPRLLLLEKRRHRRRRRSINSSSSAAKKNEDNNTALLHNILQNLSIAQQHIKSPLLLHLLIHLFLGGIFHHKHCGMAGCIPTTDNGDHDGQQTNKWHYQMDDKGLQISTSGCEGWCWGLIQYIHSALLLLHCWGPPVGVSYWARGARVQRLGYNFAENKHHECMRI